MSNSTLAWAEKLAQTHTLKRWDAEPLYVQLAALIERAIAQGEIQPGQGLGSEKDLGAIFAVGRITIRQAVDRLVARQLLVRRHGKGTFVASSRISHDIDTLNQMFRTQQSAFGKASAVLYELGTRHADETVRRQFGGASEPVSLTRLYQADGLPISVAVSWLHPQAARLSVEQASELSTSALLTEVLGLAIERTDYVFRVGKPDRESALLLKVSERTTVVTITRRRYLKDGQLGEYLVGHLLPEYYEFSFIASGNLPGASVVKLIDI